MTDQLELLAGALAPVRRGPSEPVIRSAEIEAPYRWSMTRAWGKGPTILWVPFNPSDADGKRDDPTTFRMMQFSHRWGFGSMIVMNVYPFIASKPADLHAWRRTFDHEDQSSWAAFVSNQHRITKVLTAIAADGTDPVCVAAWGHGPTPSDLEHFLRGVGMRVEDDEFGNIKIEPNWHCLGTNLDLSPIHPLARGVHRVPDDATLKMWKRRSRTQPERSSCL